MSLHFSTDLQNALHIVSEAKAICAERDFVIDYVLIVSADEETNYTGIQVIPGDGGQPVALLTGQELQFMVVITEDGTFPVGTTNAYANSVTFRSAAVAAEFLVGYLMGCRDRTGQHKATP